jgi:hypothetical protein
VDWLKTNHELFLKFEYKINGGVKVMLSGTRELQKRAFVEARKEGAGYQLMHVDMAEAARSAASTGIST